MSMQKHWLGDSERWGLTPRRFGEIRDELEDHVNCVSAQDGAAAADEQRMALATDQTRRRLNAVHLADQVYATLNRWPTRREWHEFMWLGIWFVLIVASDWISLQAQDARRSFADQLLQQDMLNPGTAFPLGTIYLTASAWALQGIARAGFFASFAVSLWRASRIGGGVALARVMQLKLIHTVLVICATLLLGDQFWPADRWSTFTMGVPWPNWLTAPVIAGVLALAGASWWILRRRQWHYGLALILGALLLYPGGPYRYHLVRVERPIALLAVADGPGRRVYVGPDNDPQHIALVAARFREFMCVSSVVMDEQANLMTCDYPETDRLPLHVASALLGPRLNWYDGEPWLLRSEFVTDRSVHVTNKPFKMKFLGRTTELRSPVSLPGAGLGWLVAPIPLLGIIGFLGLIVVLGRRSVTDFALYTVLSASAIVLTLLPFVFGGLRNELELSVWGIVGTPCPGFHYACSGDWGLTRVMLIGGFIFSAGIPWLLTSLFLRPERGRDMGPDEAIAE